MSAPLPHQWLSGADTPNSLAQQVQENFDALAAARDASAIGISYDDSSGGYFVTSGTYSDIDPGMPRLTLSAGRYLLLYGFQGGNGSIAAPVGCGLIAVDDLSVVAADTAAGENTNVARGTVQGLTAGTVILMAKSTGGSHSIIRPWMVALRWL